MTRVKICGITSAEDLYVAASAGADFVGFIFHPGSPRCITPEQAAGLTEAMRGFDVQRVPLVIGVFVAPDPNEVVDVVAQTRIQAVQIHRAEASVMHNLHERLHGAVFPAIQPRNFEEAVAAISAGVSADRVGIPFWLPQVVIDAYHPELAGGTGGRVDLELAQRVSASLDRVMLAGGLLPDTVAAVIRTAQPWAVDVSSGVEASPGQKDHFKVRRFIQAVRTVDKELEV